MSKFSDDCARKIVREYHENHSIRGVDISRIIHAETELVLASLSEMHQSAISGNFYADYDEAAAMCKRAADAIEQLKATP